MYTPAENVARLSPEDVQRGNGVIKFPDLATKEQMYGHGRMFAHVTVDPGCSIGYHARNHETEFYYIIKGEGVFNDDGKEVLVHAGDICATGYGQSHGLENKTDEPVELIALIVME